MKIVVAPDKFKGSLPAAQVAAAIAAGLHAGRPGAEVVTIPVADGGEGTVDAAVAAGFERVPVTAAGPAGDPVQASYARRGEVAVAGRSTLREAELAAAGIAAVYPLTDLEPDLVRCRAEADRLLRRTGQMIARDRLAEVATGA
jgi:glycerate kinase